MLDSAWSWRPAGRPHLPPPDSCPTPSGSHAASRRWLDVGSARTPSSGRPTPRGWGSTDRRLCVLHEPLPLWSSPNPLPVAPDPRAVGVLAQPTEPRAASTARPCRPPACAGPTGTVNVANRSMPLPPTCSGLTRSWGFPVRGISLYPRVHGAGKSPISAWPLVIPRPPHTRG